MHASTGAFVYGLYALICADLSLRTPWDYAAFDGWTPWLGVARDVANMSFLAVGLAALAIAARNELRTRRAAPSP